MPKFLILKLGGPMQMQAWGAHTYEDFRPSNLFPTRSGLLGLLGACLGLDRRDGDGLGRLASSVRFAVRVDEDGLKLPDFHTVLAARKVDGKPNQNPVVSRREYLFGAEFTVAVGAVPGAAIPLDSIAEAIRRPRYTPVLGRLSCPLGRPLFEGWREADDAIQALGQTAGSGRIYLEGDDEPATGRPLVLRDVPLPGEIRRFATRRIHLVGGDKS